MHHLHLTEILNVIYRLHNKCKEETLPQSGPHACKHPVLDIQRIRTGMNRWPIWTMADGPPGQTDFQHQNIPQRPLHRGLVSMGSSYGSWEKEEPPIISIHGLGQCRLLSRISHNLAPAQRGQEVGRIPGHVNHYRWLAITLQFIFESCITMASVWAHTLLWDDLFCIISIQSKECIPERKEDDIRKTIKIQSPVPSINKSLGICLLKDPIKTYWHKSLQHCSLCNISYASKWPKTCTLMLWSMESY